VTEHSNTRRAQPRNCRMTACAFAAALLAAQAAHAQDSAAAQANAPAATPAVTPSSSAGASGAQGRQAGSGDQGSVVMVVGTRKSVASAIDRKIRNATVSDSLVAEDINQFPDKNVGEALSRITGVQLSRSFGEGSQVAIRGVEPDLNRVEINGMSVLSTGGGAGRGAELRELASELIESIDVFKGTTADMTEGGVGGTVSIKTRKPLDFKQRTIATTISGEHSTSRGGVDPRATLLLADRFFGNRLGLMANLVYDKVLTQNDYARNTSWRFLRDWDMSAEKTVVSRDPALAAIATKAGCDAAADKTACLNQWNDYSPGIPRYGIWTRDHKRSSAELTAQYEFAKDFRAFVSYQDNKQDQRLNDRNYGTNFENINRLYNAGKAPVYDGAGRQTTAGTCNAVSTTGTPAGMTVRDHYVTEYTVGDCLYAAGQGGQGAFYTSARDFSLNVRSKYYSTGFNFKRDRLEVEGLIGKSKSDYISQSNNVTMTMDAPGLKVALDNQGLPHFGFPAGYSPEDSGAYTQVQLQYRPEEVKNTEDQVKLDLKYRLDTPFFTKVWFGAQARKSTGRQYKGGGFLRYTGDSLSDVSDDVIVPSANINQTLIYDPNWRGTPRPADNQSLLNPYSSTRYATAAQMAQLIDTIRTRSPGSFFKGFDNVSNLPSNWIAPDFNKAAPFFDLTHFNHDLVQSARASDGNVYAQIPVYGAEERVRSGYGRLDFDTELFGYAINGNVGARYTHTRAVATGSYQNKIRVATGTGISGYTDYIVENGISSVANSYHDVLPSANAMTWLVPDIFLARVGWGKVMSRPRIDLLAPNATCTLHSGSSAFGGDGTDDCTAGNPDLKPFRATNTDLSLEYYPGPDTQVSVAFFKKDISSYILEKQLQKNVDVFHDGTKWDVTQPVNGKGATTKGIEITARTAFTFLPGWLGGFGGDVNYTRMTYKYATGTERLNILDGTVLSYPGLSKNSYNVALWYDRGPINARVAYNARDRYYTGGNDVSGNPNFQEKTGYLDAKIQYRYNDNITFSIEGKNLTDQEEITDAGDLFRVNELAFSGRRYYASVSLKF